MVAHDPNVVSVTVDVVRHATHVRPKESVALRSWPYAFVDLQYDESVVGNRLQHLHLLQRRCTIKHAQLEPMAKVKVQRGTNQMCLS